MKLSRLIFIVISFTIFILSGILLFEPGSSPTGHFVYTPNIAIINQQNHAPLNQNLEIEFITKGTNDLQVTSSGEMELIELRCENKVIGNKLKYKNYTCKGNSFLVVKILSENLKLDFKFGNNIQQATNIV